MKSRSKEEETLQKYLMIDFARAKLATAKQSALLRGISATSSISDSTLKRYLDCYGSSGPHGLQRRRIVDAGTLR